MLSYASPQWIGHGDHYSLFSNVMGLNGTPTVIAAGMLFGIAIYLTTLRFVSYRAMIFGTIVWSGVSGLWHLRSRLYAIYVPSTLVLIHTLIQTAVQQIMLLYTLMMWLPLCPSGLEATIVGTLLSTVYYFNVCSNVLVKYLFLQAAIFFLVLSAGIQIFISNSVTMTNHSKYLMGEFFLKGSHEESVDLLSDEDGDFAAKLNMGTSISAPVEDCDVAAHWVMVDDETEYGSEASHECRSML